MPWSAGVVGWPAAAAAVAAFSLAFLTTRTWFGFIGAAIAAPFCVFVSGYPLFYWGGLVALASNLLAAYLLYRGRPDVAFAMLLPFMLIITVLGVFALRGITLARLVPLIDVSRKAPAPAAPVCQHR